MNMNARSLISFTAVCGALILVGGLLSAAEVPLADAIGALKSADEAVRLEAISQIGEHGAEGAQAVEPLVELLKDPSATVRARAALSLGQIGEPAKPAVPALIDLLKDADPTVRRQAIVAVRNIRPGPQVAVPLCVKLLEDSDPGVRNRVLHAIAEAGPEAVPGLIEALKNDNAAYWACLILREIGPAAKDAVPALAEKLKDPRPEIRRQAIVALAAMGDAAVPVIGQIAEQLDDSHASAAATYALGSLGQIPADAEAKVRANAKSDDKLLSSSSLWALARVHPDDKELLRQAVEGLVALLKNENPLIRQAAVHALASLPPAPEITLPIWEKALEGADEATIRQVLGVVAQMGAPAVPRLIEAMKHEKARRGVAYILGQIGPAAAPATAALANLVEDPDEDVAQEALIALAKIGPDAKDAVPVLQKVVQQPDSPNAHGAAYALGKIGPAAATAGPALVKLLDNPDPEVALVGAWALVQVHPGSAEVAAKAVPVLVAGLADPLPQARETAAKALGSLGALAKDAAPALEKATQDEDPGVRDAAAQALPAVREAAPQPQPQPQPQPTQSEAPAIERGATLLVIKEGAELRGGAELIARLDKNTQLKVLDVRGDWIGVQIDLEGKSLTGWVRRSEVRPR